MLLDRRKFITGSSLALVATGGLGSSRKAHAQSSGINTSVYNAGTAASAIACGNYEYSVSTYNDWLTLNNTLPAILKDWQANDIDSLLYPLYSEITPAQITGGAFNQTQILESIQQFQPAFTLTNVQNLLAYLNAPAVQASIEQTISSLQQGGFAPYITSWMQQTSLIAQGLGAPCKSNCPGSPVPPKQASYREQRHAGVHFDSAVYYPSDRAALRLASASCSNVNLVVAAIGVASAVIFLMTLGSATPFLLAGWAAASAWLAVGGTVVGVGNAFRCNF
jgi:hypothetical protein